MIVTVLILWVMVMEAVMVEMIVMVVMVAEVAVMEVGMETVMVEMVGVGGVCVGVQLVLETGSTVVGRGGMLVLPTPTVHAQISVGRNSACSNS